MKKLLLTLLLVGGLGRGMGWGHYECYDFAGNDRLCVSITHRGGDSYEMSTTVSGRGVYRCFIESSYTDQPQLIPYCDGRFSARGDVQLSMIYDQRTAIDHIGLRHSSIYDRDRYEYPHHRYDRDHRALRSIVLRTSASSPRVYDHVDLTLDLRDRRGRRIDDYRGYVDLAIYEYRHGRRYRAPFRHYDLEDDTIRIVADDGSVRLDDVLEFQHAGRYKVVATVEGHTAHVVITARSKSAVRSSRVDSRSFSASERKVIRRVFQQWSRYISQMQRAYPRLRRNTTRQRMQSDIAANLRDVTDGRRGEWKNYQDFYADLLVFVSYTVSVR